MDMESNSNNSGMSFPQWAARNLAAIASLILVVVLASSLLLRVVTHHGKVITVPDLTNMSVSDAKSIADSYSLKIEVTDSVYIRRMGRGMVYSQNPKEGSSVKKGRRILLTINSVTPKQTQVPNLVGYSMRQAKAELLSRGLNLGKLVYVDDIATNNVLKQTYRNRDIKPGTMVDSGTEIDLVVGLNSEENQTYVPKLVGLKYMRAVDVIHDSQLNVRKLVFDKSVKNYGDSLDAVVYRQTPEPSSASILMGSEVTIYLRNESETQEDK